MNCCPDQDQVGRELGIHTRLAPIDRRAPKRTPVALSFRGVKGVLAILRVSIPTFNDILARVSLCSHTIAATISSQRRVTLALQLANKYEFTILLVVWFSRLVSQCIRGTDQMCRECLMQGVVRY
jgi:hypothetical protein